MLSELHIENIAVIERSDIRFESGLNVLTGETGAGKSIVIDAIGAVLGDRVSRELVRRGAQKAQVTRLRYARYGRAASGARLSSRGRPRPERRQAAHGRAAPSGVP